MVTMSVSNAVQTKNGSGATIWLTGMSGAGKSTLSQVLAARLIATGQSVEVLDGDAVRTHLSKGLGFSREDRDTNVLRIAFVAGLLAKHGVIAITAAISPYAETRQAARDLSSRFIEVHIDAPLDVLIQRDVKGLYKKALSGEIQQFTGVSDPYETPDYPEIYVPTHQLSIDEAVDKIWNYLHDTGVLGLAEEALVHA